MLQHLWRISLLGGFEIRQRSKDYSQVFSNQMALLMAVLGEKPGTEHSRRDLVEEFWPETEELAGLNRFRVLLSHLRRALEPIGTPAGSVLICNRTSVALNPEAVYVDVDHFARKLRAAERSDSKDERISLYKAADEFYCGEFMAGRSGDWILGRRTHYARLQSLSQLRCSELLEQSGDLAGSLLQIGRSIEADPLREGPRKKALQLLERSGDTEAALIEYESYRKLLKKSIGLSPSHSFQEWARGLRSVVPRRKALNTEETIERSALALHPNTDRVFLPPELNSFASRPSEIAELGELLSLYRWVSVVGPGGIGKSRTAIEAARMHQDRFGAGVFYVSVGDISAPSTLLDRIVQQMQLASSPDPLESIKNYLSLPVEGPHRGALMVLDDLDGLDYESDEVIGRLLVDISNLTILSTSRRRRGARGEFAFALPPLAVPDLELPLDSAAINPSLKLFVDRATTASPRFQLSRSNVGDVLSICRRVGGVPLAIELAAAQINRTSPSELFAKLDLDLLVSPKNWRKPKQNSLNASIAFSIDGLDPADRNAFYELCVFRGSFEASAAGIVAGASLPCLDRLAENSLLSRTQESNAKRFHILDIVRDYGWAKVSAADQKQVRIRHAAFFRQLIADYVTIYLSSGIQHLEMFRMEMENVRLAANWFLEAGEVIQACEIAYSLCVVWIHYGLQREGREYIERTRSLGPADEIHEAFLNASEGILACFQEDAETGKTCIVRALAVFESNDMPLHLVANRWALGYVCYLSGEFDEVVKIAKSTNLELGSFTVRNSAFWKNLLGMSYCELPSFDDSERHLREALRLWYELGDSHIANFCRISLCRLNWKRGWLEQAWKEYWEMATLEWLDQRGLAYSCEGLGRIAADKQQFALSAKLLGAAQRVRDSIGSKRDFADKVAFDLALAATQDVLGNSYFENWQEGYSLGLERLSRWLRTLPTSI